MINGIGLNGHEDWRRANGSTYHATPSQRACAVRNLLSKPIVRTAAPQPNGNVFYCAGGIGPLWATNNGHIKRVAQLSAIQSVATLQCRPGRRIVEDGANITSS